MQLYIRQRIFSWGDSYDVYDETGEARYEVRSELFAFGHQIHVFDKRGGFEVGSIHQKLFTFLPEFEIVAGGRTLGNIRKQFSLLVPRYELDYLGWEVEGDFMGWDYRVTQGPTQIMSIAKELFRWSDCYVLDYHDPASELTGLLLVIAIDAANCSRKN